MDFGATTTMPGILFLLLALCAPALAADSAERQKLDAAAKLVDIRGEGAQPFQLEASFTAQTNLPMQGRLVWKWAAKDRWWQEVTLGDYRELQVRSGETLYTTRNLPYTPLRISNLRELLLVFPLGASEFEAKVEKRQEEGQECMQKRTRYGRHRGPWEEVCLNQQTQDVVSSGSNDGDDTRKEEFAGYAPFHEHRYPRQLKLTENGSAILRVKLDVLEDASFADTQFAPPPGAVARRQCEGMVHPVAIKQPDPTYPRSAAENNMGGLSTVEMTVQTDGSVSDVYLIGSAGREMDQVTQEIVKKWRFKPAMCGSEPVVSDVRVEMDFRLSR